MLFDIGKENTGKVSFMKLPLTILSFDEKHRNKKKKKLKIEFFFLLTWKKIC